MPLKHVHYQRLETEDSEEVEEDESPPTHQLNGSHHVRGNRWNHVENLDIFFERVYQYQQQHGLLAIALGDLLELVQFAFMVLFAAFLLTCLRFSLLLADKVPVHVNNTTEMRDIYFSDLFDLSRLHRMNALVVLFILLSLLFWAHRLIRAGIRFIKFWEIRTFYIEALNIQPWELRDFTWPDVVLRLKAAQREHKMNIRKQELTELDVYHRILRFPNYLVAMINKNVLPCKFSVPFYGEKVFLTQGLQFNYELLLFWGPGAPFRNSFHLRDEYKSAVKKPGLVKNLRFRITVLAFLNLLFLPVVLLYQTLYSFFSYAELVKRQPGVFGRRRWSLYGHWFLRDFNELDHELRMRLNRAYKPSVLYMDLFANPIVVIFARNVAFFAGSLLAVLLVMTVLQEDLLTAHNVLTIITMLGLLVTACRVFVPDENQVWCPQYLMQQILGEVHYMPDHWKMRPHAVDVYQEYTHVFQFTLMKMVDELFSPLLTPFILFFALRNKSSDIVDFLRNFTIDVYGVGDVCSFAEMNVKRHGNPEWLTKGVSRANQYEQAELGKTEISLMHFSRKNPDWQPGDGGATFMSNLKESVDELQRSGEGLGAEGVEESLTYLTLESAGPSASPARAAPHLTLPPGSLGDSMQWSVWSARPGHLGGAGRLLDQRVDPNLGSLSTLQLHQIHDQHMARTPSPTLPGQQHLTTLYSSQASIENAWRVSDHAPSSGADFSAPQPAGTELSEPLLQDEGTSPSHPPPPPPYSDTAIQIPADSDVSDHA